MFVYKLFISICFQHHEMETILCLVSVPPNVCHARFALWAHVLLYLLASSRSCFHHMEANQPKKNLLIKVSGTARLSEQRLCENICRDEARACSTAEAWSRWTQSFIASSATIHVNTQSWFDVLYIRFDSDSMKFSILSSASGECKSNMAAVVCRALRHYFNSAIVSNGTLLILFCLLMTSVNSQKLFCWNRIVPFWRAPSWVKAWNHSVFNAKLFHGSLARIWHVQSLTKPFGVNWM